MKKERTCQYRKEKRTSGILPVEKTDYLMKRFGHNMTEDMRNYLYI
jgi:hypothetical protein